MSVMSEHPICKHEFMNRMCSLLNFALCLDHMHIARIHLGMLLQILQLPINQRQLISEVVFMEQHQTWETVSSICHQKHNIEQLKLQKGTNNYGVSTFEYTVFIQYMNLNHWTKQEEFIIVSDINGSLQIVSVSWTMFLLWMKHGFT